jgi:hypothetical protein
MTGEKQTGKDLEGSGHSPIKVLFQNILGGTEENHKNFSHDKRCPSSGLKQAPPEYAPRVSPLFQTARCQQPASLVSNRKQICLRTVLTVVEGEGLHF